MPSETEIPEVQARSSNLQNPTDSNQPITTDVLMLVGTPPHSDPRIDWQVQTILKRSSVTVLGINAKKDTTRHPLITVEPGFYRLSLPQIRTQKELNNLTLFNSHLNQVFSKQDLFQFKPLGFALGYGIWRSALKISNFFYRAFCKLPGGKTLLAKTILRPAHSPHPIAFTEFQGSKPELPQYQQLKKFEWMLSHFAVRTFTFWNYLAELPVKPRVIHCNDLDTLLVGVMAKKAYGCKLMYDAHEFWAVSYQNPPWFLVPFFLWLENHLIHEADAVTTVSPLIAKAMQKAYQLKRVNATPNCEPWQEVQPLPDPTEVPQLAAGRLIFLFQGGFAPTRGLEDLIAAWRDVDSTRAALFLRGPDNAFKQYCITLAKAYGVLDKGVYFPASVTETELVGASLEADVGVIPYAPVCLNNQFACPNKLSQFMQAGLMILCNQLDYVKAKVNKYKCGLHYDSTDAATLHQAVQHILDHPEELATFKANAKAMGEKEYHWQGQCAPVLDKLYANWF